MAKYAELEASVSVSVRGEITNRECKRENPEKQEKESRENGNEQRGEGT